MSTFGVGTLLYFQALKKLAYCFLIMTILAAPKLFLVTYSALTRTDYQNRFSVSALTLAGLGTTANTTDLKIPFISTPVSRQQIGLVCSVCDVLYSFAFLIFIYFLNKDQTAEAERADAENCTESDYTAKIDNLPEDCDDRGELQKFFAEAIEGNVFDVVIAYNDGEVILLYKQRGILKQKLAAAEKRKDEKDVEKFLEEIRELDVKINDVSQKLEKRPVCAYVTFENQDGLRELLTNYPQSFWSKCCAKQQYKFRGSHFFRVQRAPEPSNIFYHNLAYTNNQKLFRRFITLLVTFIALCMSFGIIFAAQYYQSQLPQEAECPPAVTPVQSQISITYKNCYCKQHVGELFSDKQLQNYCFDWLKQFSIAQGLLIASSFVVILVNFGLVTFITKLVQWEKHSSVSNQEAAIFTKMFIGMFVNTALIALLVNANFSEYGFNLFSGPFKDLNSDWYKAVAEGQIITMLLNTVNPQIVNVILIPVTGCLRARKKDSCVTQRELNELYHGEPFELAPRYAAVQNTIFVTLFYSGAMPVLLPLAILSFFFTYWFDRAALFHLHSTPPKFDDRLAEQSAKIMPYAIIGHCLISIWAYSAPNLNSAYSLSGVLSKVGSPQANAVVNQAQQADGVGLSVSDRLLNWNAVPPFLVLVVYLASILLTFLKGRLNFLTCRGASKVVPVEGDQEGEDLPFSVAMKKFRFKTYRINDQEFYQDAYIRTDSKKQLKPMNNIGESDGWKKDDDAKRIEMETPHDQALDVDADPEAAPASSSSSSQDLALEMVQQQAAQMQAWSQNLSPEALVLLHQQFLAAATNPDSLISIQCPSCYEHLQVVDTGEEAEYACPYCGNNFMA